MRAAAVATALKGRVTGFMDRAVEQAMGKLDARFGELRAILEEMVDLLRQINAKIGPGDAGDGNQNPPTP